MTVRGDERSLAVLQKLPRELLGARPVQAEQARSVHLQGPAAAGQLFRDARIVEDGLGALGVADDRLEATGLDVLAHPKEDVRTPGERDLDEHTAGAFELVSSHVLTQEPGMWGQLEPEPQLQACVWAHLPVGLANGYLALSSERQVRPDVRSRKQDRRAVRSRLATKLDPLANGRSAVVTGWKNVRMAVDEEGPVPH